MMPSVLRAMLVLPFLAAGPGGACASGIDAVSRALHGAGDVCDVPLAHCVEAALQAHLAPRYEKVELKVLRSEAGSVPLRTGELVRVRRIQWTGSPARRMTVWLDVVSGAKVSRSIPVEIEVHAYVTGWRATADLRPAATAMNEADLIAVAVDVTAQSAAPWQGSVGAHRLRKPLLAGQTLTSAHVERVTLVTRGQQVEVKVGSADLRIDAQGQALQDGQVGDLIQVRVARSAAAVTGRVTGPGAVEVVW